MNSPPSSDSDSKPAPEAVPFMCRPWEIRLLLQLRQGWGRVFSVDTDAMTVEEIRYGNKASFGTAEEKVEFLRRQLV